MTKKSKKIILFLLICVTLLFLINLCKYCKKIDINKHNISNEFTKIIQNIKDKNEIEVEINENTNILIGNNCKIKIKSNNDIVDKRCVVNVSTNKSDNYQFLLDDVEKEKTLELSQEGKYNININIYNDIDTIYKKDMFLYVINPYQHQFAENLSNFGLSTHFGLNYNRDEVDNGLEILENLGVRNIRDTILWEHVRGENGIYDYSIPDLWVPYIKNKDINILALLSGGDRKQLNDDLQISNEEELRKYEKYADNVIKKYPYIKEFQIFNEPNDKWTSEEQKKWYSKATITVKNILKNEDTYKKTVVGSVAIKYLEEKESLNYLKDIFMKYKSLKYSNISAYHMYTSQENMQRLKEVNEYSRNMQNEIGGFTYRYINEFGITSNSKVITEEERARKIIKQYLISINNGIEKCYLYDFRDTSKEIDGPSRYGLLNYDYTPKESYYIIKNFLENTNGAEYIGNLELAEELEAHVYDKDGKPVIIAWSNNNNKNIEIDYKNFIAKDIYGKEIKANEKGKLVITTSPVYIYNLDYKYYYKAISNVATEKYEEFEEKFSEQISKMPNVQDKIEQMKTYMQNVGKAESKILEETSIKTMKMHYEIGNKILEEYKNKQIEVEPVKISSMLDALDDIGNSYEDLVTVAAQTREPKLEQTKSKIEKAEEKIKNNSEIEIIYPSKILEFSKDYYEKAEYINGLEEENDIKTGLIMSKKLHSELLADWSDIFSQIQIDNYIDKYISDNPVTIEYTETNLTNKDVKATIVTNAQIEIKNNNNRKEYTFKENGEFTFEYTIKGRNKTIKAKVNNIDKQAPQITNVEADKIYIDKATPQIYDENLKEIKLILNEEEIPNYKSGTELKEEGFYKLTATDKAGNETSIQFQIIVNKEDDYKIKDNIIKNIDKETTKKNFVKKLNLKIPYEIYRNDKKIEENDIICTGDKLVTQTGEEYILIVAGDLNRDGNVNIKDMVKMRIYLLEENNLDEIEKIAADTNIDEKTITIKDFVRMRLIVLM